MLVQSDSSTRADSATGRTSVHPSATDMGRGGALSGYGGQISGYNTKAHRPAPALPSAVSVGGGGMQDKPLDLPPIYKPVLVRRLVDRDGAEWDLVPGRSIYRNASTGDLRYSPPAGSRPIKIKPKS